MHGLRGGAVARKRFATAVDSRGRALRATAQGMQRGCRPSSGAAPPARDKVAAAARGCYAAAVRRKAGRVPREASTISSNVPP
jgi:hypothetical protein